MDYFSKDIDEKYEYKERDDETIAEIEKSDKKNDAKNKFAKTFKIDTDFYNMIAILSRTMKGIKHKNT